MTLEREMFLWILLTLAWVCIGVGDNTSAPRSTRIVSRLMFVIVFGRIVWLFKEAFAP